MTFDSMLIDTCLVERYTAGAQDDYGNPAKTWADHLLDEPCRLMTTGGTEIRIGAEVVIANYKLFIGDSDITEQDRVTIDSVVYEVLLVEDKQNGTTSHHKECYLRVVR